MSTVSGELSVRPVAVPLGVMVMGVVVVALKVSPATPRLGMSRLLGGKPAPLRTMVSPLAGARPRSQLVGVLHLESVVPFHVMVPSVIVEKV